MVVPCPASAAARAGPRARAAARVAARVAAWAATLLLASLLGLAPAPSDAAPAPSAEEAAQAEALARAVPWAAEDRVRARDEDTPLAHPLGVQTLVVEAEQRKHAAPGERRARVYQHDHGRRRSRRVTVDLAAGRVLETRALASVHLPLAEAERVWALGRLAASPALLEALREEQRRRGAEPFARLDALEIKASVYEPADPAHPCARERCALIALFDETRTVFALEPVVRFADGELLPLGRGAR